MKIREFDTNIVFLEHIPVGWQAHEAACGVLFRTANANEPGMRYLAVLDDLGNTLLAACLHPADQVIMAGFEPSSAAALGLYLAERDTSVPGIFAPKALTEAFAQSFSAKTGKTFGVVKRLGHYALTSLEATQAATGNVRHATLAEKQTLTAFRNASQIEGNTQRPVDSAATVAQEINAQCLYVLALPNGQIASTGAIHCNKSPTSGYVDAIYTPPQHRGKGHATRLVCALSEKILAKNLTARLSVDLENAPAIAVYEKLGYRLECQMSNLRQV